MRGTAAASQGHATLRCCNLGCFSPRRILRSTCSPSQFFGTQLPPRPLPFVKKREGRTPRNFTGHLRRRVEVDSGVSGQDRRPLSGNVNRDALWAAKKLRTTATIRLSPDALSRRIL